MIEVGTGSLLLRVFRTQRCSFHCRCAARRKQKMDRILRRIGIEQASQSEASQNQNEADTSDRLPQNLPTHTDRWCSKHWNTRHVSTFNYVGYQCIWHIWFLSWCSHELHGNVNSLLHDHQMMYSLILMYCSVAVKDSPYCIMLRKLICLGGLKKILENVEYIYASHIWTTKFNVNSIWYATHSLVSSSIQGVSQTLWSIIVGCFA